MPKVSIIMPAYNEEKHIAEAIESVIKQTYQDWELLIINDGSVDNTRTIAQQYAAEDQRIVLIDNEKNMGVVRTRNNGIDQMTGRYLAFLDSDDCWYPHKLETQIKVLENKGYPFVFSSYDKMDEEGKPLKKKVRVKGRYNYQKMLKANFVGILTAIYDTRQITRKYFVSDFLMEDYNHWLNILKEIDFLYAVEEPLARYRVRETSLSSNKWKVIKADYDIYRRGENLSIFKSLYYTLSHIFIKVFRNS